jgi:hypothetical protein
MDGLIAYFESDKTMSRTARACGHAGVYAAPIGPGLPEADITEQYRIGLRTAIDDHQRAIDNLHDTGAQ